MGDLLSVGGGIGAAIVWTAAKTWTQVYAEVVAQGGFCTVLVEPGGANRNLTTGSYNINGIRFIGMPQLDTASVGYGAVKVVINAGVTFLQDGTTLFAVISSQDVFWYFDSAVQPVQLDKIRIRLDGGKMHADAGSVFTNITEARVYLSGGAHLQGYSTGSDALIQLADGALAFVESYAGRLMFDVFNTPGTAFSAFVQAWLDPATVVVTSPTGGWLRPSNTTAIYRGFWSSNVLADANALSMLSSSGTLYKPYILDNGQWSNVPVVAQQASWSDDFISVSDIATSTAGGGAVLNNPTPISTMVGLVRLTGGIGGSACVFPNADPANVGFASAIFNFGSGKFTCEWRVKWLGPIPTAIADARAFIGVHDLPIFGGSGGVPSDGAWFQAGWAMNGNDNWWARITGGGNAVVDTGIPISGVPARLKVVVEFNVDAKYYINDVLVATILATTADTDNLDLTVAADGLGISTLINIALDYYTFDYQLVR